MGEWWEGLGTRPSVILHEEHRYLGDNDSWKARVRECLEALTQRSDDKPEVKVGGICSSDTNLQDPALASLWVKMMMHDFAVEMESAGVLKACRPRQGSTGQPFLTFRGISDVIGYERTAAWTQRACDVAARFAVGFLAFAAANRRFLPQRPNP